jgi:GT2 family glycosyltransferase
MEANQITLDIVIPSFRVDIEVLQKILQLEIPSSMERRVIVVLDNPEIIIPDDCKKLEEREDVSILINQKNIGAGGSRNRGIEHSTADWILFLDDDIHPEDNLLHVYGGIIGNHDYSAPGYAGITRFPQPTNTFTKGFVCSGLLHFFDLPEHRDDVTWSATSNILFNRKAIGEHRFGDQFPKAGGGEDIDFCFQIQKSFGARFQSAPEAIVHHPWWSDSKRRYRRAFRWGFSDTMLPSIYKEHSWRDIPNTVETLCVFLLLSIPLYMYSTLEAMEIVLFSGLILTGEWISEWVRQILSNKVYNPISAIESSTIRLAFALGGVYYLISSLKLLEVGKKFDYGYSEWPKQNRKWSMLRVSVQAALILLYSALAH